MEHKFVHVEIPAKEFYEKVFGWKVLTKSASPDHMLFVTGETGVGGEGFRDQTGRQMGRSCCTFRLTTYRRP